MIMSTLKKQLEKAKGRWVEELPRVMCASTTIQASIRSTPFSLVYGAEVVLPTEVLVKTARTSASFRH